MNPSQTTCDSQRLRLLLAEQLPEDLAASTAEHLAACRRCREELESLAGEPAWWTEVAACLQAATDRPSGATRAAAGLEPADFERVDSHAEEFLAADFAVEFLDPCERAEALGKIGGFEVLEVIGRGGMSVVLKGFQRELGRYVAVKVMAPHLAASGSARQRFDREARAAAAIVHPHVMAIHAVGATGKLPYLVMPYVACESLQQRIDRDGPLELAEILRIGVQTAAGLAAAHAQGLVHRDVKPANILLEKGVDRVLLTDFGLVRTVDDASVTRTGIIAGTPQFMSPEQARGESVDPRSDLFSLGSVLYAACTGRAPFRAETSYGVLRRITDSHARPVREINPAIPEWLEGIVARLHAKQAAKRFSSAEEVSALLERCLAHVQQPTVAPLPESLAVWKGREKKKREPGWWRTSRVARGGVAISIFAIIFAGLFVAFRMPRDDVRSANEPATANGATTAPIPADDSSATAAWDDGAAEQILDLNQSTQAFDQRAGRLWDEPVEHSFHEETP